MLINNLKTRLVKDIHVFLSSLEHENLIIRTEIEKVNFENISLGQPKNKAFGDLTINAAMVLAPVLKKSPMHIAEMLKEQIIEKWEETADINIAAPGFINFFIDYKFLASQLAVISKKADVYGLNSSGAGVKIQLEYVSANPTGNLHIGHGRWAALGDSLSNIYAANGFDVWREYYVNDYGSQIKKFADCMASLYLRNYKKTMPYPEDGYPEETIKTVVDEIISRDGRKYFLGGQTETKYDSGIIGGMKTTNEKELINEAGILNGVEPGKSRMAGDAGLKNLSDSPGGNLEEKNTDEYYEIDIDQLGKEGVRIMLLRIEKTLESMGVRFDEWFCESSLYEGENFENSLDLLKEKGIVYEKENALWFKAQEFGDDKDRVIIRTGGEPTYFASDIMYLINKAARGFTRLIYILGADHHGYIKRLHAIGKAAGFNDKNVEVVIGQLVRLVKKGEAVRMSKRKGKVYSLDDLVAEVGSDAVRFFFSANSFDTPMDFDLDLAKQKSNKNPVYYVQYVHARIASVIEKAIGLYIKGELKADKKEIDLEIFGLIAGLNYLNTPTVSVVDISKAGNKANNADIDEFSEKGDVKSAEADSDKVIVKNAVSVSDKAYIKSKAMDAEEFSMTKDNYEAIFSKIISQLDFSGLVLKNIDEIELAKILLFYPDIVFDACKNNAPHFINKYLYRLASQFHYFYNHHRIIDGSRLNVNRLKLVMAVKVVLTNALNLLKITAPVKM